MKYLKLFSNVSEYDAFKVSDEFVLPNVSYCKNDRSVFYNAAGSNPSPYVMVDLGLPSGLLWADRNVGAASPEDAGLYFQWGDTVGYTAEQVANGEKNFASDWSDYWDTTDGGVSFNKYGAGKLIRLDASDDAATVNMGSEYRMPTRSEFQELIDNCIITYIDLEDNEVESIEGGNLKVIKFTGPNSNSIFIPAAGNYKDSSLTSPEFIGSSIWASDLNEVFEGGSNANCFAFYSDLVHMVLDSCRYLGNLVRGVQSAN